MVARAPIAGDRTSERFENQLLRVELEVFVRREDAERFIEGVRGSA